jgi:hypothetical protein
MQCPTFDPLPLLAGTAFGKRQSGASCGSEFCSGVYGNLDYSQPITWRDKEGRGTDVTH